MKKKSYVVWLIILSMLLMSCTSTDADVGAETERVIREDLIVALDAPLSTLEPTAIMGVSSVIMLQSFYDTLIKLDENLEPVPSVAKSWEVSDDGLEYIFHLNENIEFTNGEKLTSEDVVFSFQRLLAEPIGMFYGQYISGAEVVDEYTVKITTPAVFDGIYSTLSSIFLILPKDYTESVDGNLAETAIGSGPYVIKEFIAGSHIVLEANSGYFMGEPEIKTLTMKFIPDASTRTISLQSGDVDFVYNPALQDRQLLMDEEDFVYDESVSVSRYGVALSNFGALTDIKLREAIINGINNEEIFNAIGDGLGEVLTTSFAPKAFPKYVDYASSNGYDLEKAKAALKESDYDGETPIIVTVLDPTSQKIAEVMQNQLSQIGITLKIENVEGGTYYQRVSEGTIEISISFGGSSTFGPQEEIGGYTSMQDMSNRWPDNAEVDALYLQLISEGDYKERCEIIESAYETINDLYISTPLYSPLANVAYRKGLSGVAVQIEGIYTFNQLNWE